MELTAVAPESAAGTFDVTGLADTGLNVETLSLPAAVDNSTLSAFPQIGNQGQLGSCAAFSTTYYQLTYTLALQRGWNAKTGGTAYHMSPKWTYNMLNGGYDDGVSRDGCLLMGIQNGCATWAEVPYSTSKTPETNFRAWVYNSVSIWRAALNRRLSVWGTVTALDTDEGLYRLKQLLNNGHILTFGTYVTSWSQVSVGDDPATADDTLFVGQKICRYVAGSAGPPAMTIVGYNDTLWCDINGNSTVDIGEKGALKIANQYGTSHSAENSGFRWLAYDALRESSRVPGVSGPAGRTPAITLGAPTWVAAQPQAPNPLVGVYRVKHSRRDQMTMFIGIGTTDDVEPTATWSFMPSGAGGAFRFDGTTGTTNNAQTGTFAVSMDAIAPVSGSTRRYFLGMRDAGNNVEYGEIFQFQLENPAGTVLAVTNTSLKVDGGPTFIWPYPTKWVWVDYLLPAAVTSVVSVIAPGSLACESGSVTGLFRIVRTGDTAQPCSVALTVDGTATEAEDYQMLTRLVVIPAGTNAVDLAVRAIDDWSVEETESVTLSLLPDPGYSIGPFSNATVDILSDDTLALVVPSRMRVEEGTIKPLTGVLTAAPAAPLTITFSIMPRSYTTCTLPANPTFVTRDATNWYQPFSVNITVPENVKTGEFNMGSVNIDAPGISGTEVTIYEVDNEKPNLIIDPDILFVPEGSNAELRVKYTYPPTQTTTVLVQIASRSTQDPDLQVVSGGTMVFDAANWNSWQIARIAAGQDEDWLDGRGVCGLRLQGNGWNEFDFPVYEVDDDLPPDSDGDGIRDPDDPDDDNDGMTDEAEAVAGTDPLDPESYLRFTDVQSDPGIGGIVLGFNSVTGRVYWLQSATGLTSSVWTPGTGLVGGTGARVEVTGTNAATRSFYRLGVSR
ncbi:MAG: hypothetical protein FJ224_11420 [Lentisphaerae bacterium]|nr:hypothetical protein [Lentisphaerota bacterium]